MGTRREFIRKSAVAGVAGIVHAGAAPMFAKERALRSGVTLEEASPGRPEGPLSGSTFVLTGKLPGLTRGQVRELIEAAGGRVVGSVSGSTDYVVVGEDPGSKLERAQALGVRVIDEGRLRELAGGG